MLLEPVPEPEKRVQRKDTVSFDCREGLACFGTCCRNRDLVLTPYDVCRLKKALNIHSDVFLDRYALYRIDPSSGFPVLSLRMKENETRDCPLVGPEGCTVYRDRPTACRVFPLARATRWDPTQEREEEVFFFMETPGCMGVEEDKPQLLEAWLHTQGLSPFFESNNRMLRLLFHPARDRAKPLEDHQLQKVFVACYSLDVFRDFLFNTRILESMEMDAKTRSEIAHNDEQLLNVGFAYLEKTLFR